MEELSDNMTYVNEMIDSAFTSIFNIKSFMRTYERTDKEYTLSRFDDWFKSLYNKTETDPHRCGGNFRTHYKQNGDRRLYCNVRNVCNIATLSAMGEYMSYRPSEVHPSNYAYDRYDLKNHMEDVYKDYIVYYLEKNRYASFMKELEHYWDATVEFKPAD